MPSSSAVVGNHGNEKPLPPARQWLCVSSGSIHGISPRRQLPNLPRQPDDPQSRGERNSHANTEVVVVGDRHFVPVEDRETFQLKVRDLRRFFVPKNDGSRGGRAAEARFRLASSRARVCAIGGCKTSVAFARSTMTSFAPPMLGSSVRSSTSRFFLLTHAEELTFRSCGRFPAG